MQTYDKQMHTGMIGWYNNKIPRRETTPTHRTDKECLRTYFHTASHAIMAEASNEFKPADVKEGTRRRGRRLNEGFSSSEISVAHTHNHLGHKKLPIANCQLPITNYQVGF